MTCAWLASPRFIFYESIRSDERRPGYVITKLPVVLLMNIMSLTLIYLQVFEIGDIIKYMLMDWRRRAIFDHDVSTFI